MKERNKLLYRWICKYVNILELLDENLLVLSISSKNIRVAWFMSAIGAPTGLITSFFTINLFNHFQLSWEVKTKKNNNEI